MARTLGGKKRVTVKAHKRAGASVRKHQRTPISRKKPT